MTIVLVTALEFEKAREVFEGSVPDGLECLRAPEDERDLAEAIRDHDARHVIVGVEPYKDLLYDALPRGGVIARFGVGHDGIDKGRATDMGLYCTNTPGVLDDSVAELTIGLILSAMRYMSIASAEIRHRHWCAIFGSEMRGKTLAIIGCGAIGCRVARIASQGFGMSVVGCDVMPLDATELISEFGFSDMAGDFASAVSEADVVSLHIPATSETRHFIDRDRLALMPNAAWLVNTSRGSIVDEAALYDAIIEGRLAGAALDVFEHEPYEPVALDKDLRQLDDVIMTPHVGSSTREACNRMARRALENIAAAEAGRFSDMDIINPAILDQ